MKTEREILLRVLESLLAGETSCESAQKEIDNLTMKEFQELYSNLHHYYDDEDIREKDPEYKAFQNIELEKLINHLKSGEISKANGISFIHVS